MGPETFQNYLVDLGFRLKERAVEAQTVAIAAKGTDKFKFLDGAAGALNPLFSVLTDPLGYDSSNTMANPQFRNSVVNGDAGQGIQQTELTTAVAVQPALDEGGNFIDVRFGPLTMSASGNYHIRFISSARQFGDGTSVLLADDVDGDTRNDPDSGADERRGPNTDPTLIDNSRYRPGFKLAEGIAVAGAAGLSSGSGNLSLSGLPASSGFGGLQSVPGEDDEEADNEETGNDAPGTDVVRSISLDIGAISTDTISKNETNEQSN